MMMEGSYLAAALQAKQRAARERADRERLEEAKRAARQAAADAAASRKAREQMEAAAAAAALVAAGVGTTAGVTPAKAAASIGSYAQVTREQEAQKQLASKQRQAAAAAAVAAASAAEADAAASASGERPGSPWRPGSALRPCSAGSGSRMGVHALPRPASGSSGLAAACAAYGGGAASSAAAARRGPSIPAVAAVPAGPKPRVAFGATLPVAPGEQPKRTPERAQQQLRRPSPLRSPGLSRPASGGSGAAHQLPLGRAAARTPLAPPGRGILGGQAAPRAMPDEVCFSDSGGSDSDFLERALGPGPGSAGAPAQHAAHLAPVAAKPSAWPALFTADDGARGDGTGTGCRGASSGMWAAVRAATAASDAARRAVAGGGCDAPPPPSAGKAAPPRRGQPAPGACAGPAAAAARGASGEPHIDAQEALLLASLQRLDCKLLRHKDAPGRPVPGAAAGAAAPRAGTGTGLRAAPASAGQLAGPRLPARVGAGLGDRGGTGATGVPGGSKFKACLW